MVPVVGDNNKVSDYSSVTLKKPVLSQVRRNTNNETFTRSAG